MSEYVQRRTFAHDLQPQARTARRKVSGSLTRVFAGIDDALVLPAVDELDAALGLVVKVVVLSGYLDGCREIVTHAAVLEVAVVSDVAVERLAPEICLGISSTSQRRAFEPPVFWRIKPRRLCRGGRRISGEYA